MTSVATELPETAKFGKYLIGLALCFSLDLNSWAQGVDSQNQNQPMASMSMSGMSMQGMNAAGMFLMNDMSGTAANPEAWAMPMLSRPLGTWSTMFMAQAFLDDTQQSGPRGGDKLYSPNWLMLNAEHAAGRKGAIEFQLMLSLEPATVTERRYPLLFQTGETAFGMPIVDGQHPHNFIMSMGIQYALPLGQHTTLEFYFAPVGDPALGPVAYPHRASAGELPQATIAHHWEDSTHISDEVVTAGIAYRKVRLEASGFYGSEPGEDRWTIEGGPINSWSTRLWYFPGKQWAAQVSTGHLTRPEALDPGDQFRTTASLEYSKPLRGESWSSSLIWGRIHGNFTRRNMDAYTMESVLPAGKKNFVTGRMELVDKDDLFEGQPGIEQYLDAHYGSTFRVGEYTLGFTRDIELFPDIETGVGANMELYSLPEAIKPYYGEHPMGGNIFFRFRLRPRK